MQNGYFQLTEDNGGVGLALYMAKDGGEELHSEEIIEYLDGYGLPYERSRLEMLLMDDSDAVYHLGSNACPSIPETYKLNVSEDGMLATVRFYPPSSAGKRISFEDFMKDVRYRKIVFGIQEEAVRRHFQLPQDYCTDIILAKGQEAVAGTDARIEYLFETDLHRKPTQREDGSVDYFKMTTINQCRKGDVLARIIPETQGVPGSDVYGRAITPRMAKPAVLKFGRNIVLSEDRRSISTSVNGHVTLVDDKVFVSDVYEVPNVDVSTGNLEFEGSIQVNGDVKENFSVKAGGNVIVNGLVEGASITAGGSIIISKGMNGMAKGQLKAGGDVIVRFLENTRVIAGGYVHAEAILHSKISSGNEVTVEGRKGLIVGGYVQAAKGVTAKCIGGSLGATTILEVGVNPLIKAQYTKVQKAISESTKTMKDSEVILANFKDNIKKGVQYNEAQLNYMKSVSALIKTKEQEQKQLETRLEKLRQMMEIQKQAAVVVNDEIYPGTTIIIGDSTKTIQNSYHYCRFVREKGEICMAPM